MQSFFSDLTTARFYLEKVGGAYKKSSHYDFRDQTTRRRATMETVPRAGDRNEGEQRRVVSDHPPRRRSTP